MSTDRKTPKMLGVAQLAVAVAAMASGLLLMPVIGTGTSSEMLTSISENFGLLRASILFELINSAAIMVLEVVFYIVFHKQCPTIALVAWVSAGRKPSRRRYGNA
jgi:hypothetical protein